MKEAKPNKKQIQDLFRNTLMLICLLPSCLVGQVVFEIGYFFDNNGEKTDCLIRNVEWKNSPTKIEYKLNDTSATENAGIEDIKEFKVSNYKYRRTIVDIDQSVRTINGLDDKKEPVFKKDTVFLRIIVEGSATLFFHGTKELYFFNVEGSPVKQLIHKEYIVENKVLTNNKYKSQLFDHLKCEGITQGYVKKLNYNLADLTQVFVKYNKCKDAEYTRYNFHTKRDAFNLYLLAGARISSFKLRNSMNKSQNIDYPDKTNFNFGVEAEYVFPFNKNKWALVFRPFYQSYYAEESRPNYNNTVDYQSIELATGIKYSMFLSTTSKIFFYASPVLVDLPIKSTIGSLNVSYSNNFDFGLGYNYNNRISAEIHYGFGRDLMREYVFYSSDYNYFSFNLGVNIF
jgi:hypothetical protein